MNHKVLDHIKFIPIIMSARKSFPSYFHVVFVAQLIPSCHIVGREPLVRRSISLSLLRRRKHGREDRTDNGS